MRLYSFVAAAALASASLAAHADTITQTFAIPFQAYAGTTAIYSRVYSTSLNPAVGTLNSVSLFANGTVTIAGSSSVAPSSSVNLEVMADNTAFTNTSISPRTEYLTFPAVSQPLTPSV